MKLPVISIIALFFFTIAAVFYVQDNKVISRETVLENHRAKFHIEPIVSPDGQFALSLCSPIPLVTSAEWAVNHNRTFRAYLKTIDVQVSPTIILEQAQPRRCFELKNNSVLQNVREVYWPTPTVLGFTVGTTSDQLVEYLVNIQTLSSTHHPFIETSVHARKNASKLID